MKALVRKEHDSPERKLAELKCRERGKEWVMRLGTYAGAGDRCVCLNTHIKQ